MTSSSSLIGPGIAHLQGCSPTLTARPAGVNHPRRPVFGMTAMVMYLSDDSIRDLLRWDQLIATMEEALAGFSLGRVLQPVRNMLTIEEGKRYLGIMPAVAEDAMGAKLVSFYPGNAGTGVPTHSAMILLFNPQT